MRARLTTAQAAAAGHCDKSTVCRLIKLGKLEADRTGGGRGTYLIRATREQVREAVLATAPRSGFRHGSVARNQRTSQGLSAVMAWLALPAPTRRTLLRLAVRFKAE